MHCFIKAAELHILLEKKHFMFEHCHSFHLKIYKIGHMPLKNNFYSVVSQICALFHFFSGCTVYEFYVWCSVMTRDGSLENGGKV